MINHQSLDITLYKSFPMGKMGVVSLRFIFGKGSPESFLDRFHCCFFMIRPCLFLL